MWNKYTRKTVLAVALMMICMFTLIGCGKKEKTDDGIPNADLEDVINQVVSKAIPLDEYIQPGWEDAYIAGKMEENGIDMQVGGWYESLDGAIKVNTWSQGTPDEYVVISIDPTSETVYSIYGISCGMTFVEACARLEAQGATLVRGLKEYSDELKIIKYELLGKYSMEISTDGTIVDSVLIATIAGTEEQEGLQKYDLAEIIDVNMEVEDVVDAFEAAGIDMVYTIDDTYINCDRSLEVYSRNDTGCKIEVTESNLAEYSIAGACIGMESTEFEGRLSANGFQAESPSGFYYYNDDLKVDTECDDDSFVILAKCSVLYGDNQESNKINTSNGLIVLPDNMHYAMEPIENITGNYVSYLDYYDGYQMDINTYSSSKDRIIGSVYISDGFSSYDGELEQISTNVYLVKHEGTEVVLISIYEEMNINDEMERQVELYINGVCVERLVLNEDIY